MRFRGFDFLIAMMLAGTIILVSQETTSPVKHATAAATPPSSGKEMFMSYCASCPGKDAKGNGPAALGQAPADLIGLARQHGGKYPSDPVTSVLRGQRQLMAHGDQDMPVWGPVFWKISQGHEELVQMRIANLNKYLESLQEK